MGFFLWDKLKNMHLTSVASLHSSEELTKLSPQINEDWATQNHFALKVQ
jgi:hypothetical protein